MPSFNNMTDASHLGIVHCSFNEFRNPDKEKYK